MPSKRTTNYQLSQWEADDKVLRTDFNDDNDKLDKALKALDTGKAEQSALNSLTSTVNTKASQSDVDALKSGKADVSALNALKSTVSTLDGAALRAKCGSYSGNGKYGEANAKTLTFDRLPYLLIIRKSGGYEGMVAPRGLTNSTADMASGGATTTITWDSGEKQVTWYGNVPRSHFNESGITYYYVAIY